MTVIFLLATEDSKRIDSELEPFSLSLCCRDTRDSSCRYMRWKEITGPAYCARCREREKEREGIEGDIIP